MKAGGFRLPVPALCKGIEEGLGCKFLTIRRFFSNFHWKTMRYLQISAKILLKGLRSSTLKTRRIHFAAFVKAVYGLKGTSKNNEVRGG